MVLSSQACEVHCVGRVQSTRRAVPSLGAGPALAFDASRPLYTIQCSTAPERKVLMLREWRHLSGGRHALTSVALSFLSSHCQAQPIVVRMSEPPLPLSSKLNDHRKLCIWSAHTGDRKHSVAISHDLFSSKLDMKPPVPQIQESI